MSCLNPRAYKVFLATAYPQSELAGTMKHLLACLALCASLSASAQDDCALFNIQSLATENQSLASENQELQDSIAALNTELDNCGADLSGGADLQGITLVNPDLSGANLSGVYLDDSRLTNANLSGANLSGGDLKDSRLPDADLSGANLNNAFLTNANLSGANLSGASLYGANLTNTDLSGANLSGAFNTYLDLHGVNSGANFSGANLSGANLSGAILICLEGCPAALPSGYICEPDPDCAEPNVPDPYRIVAE